MSDEALAATTNPEPAVSLTDILKAVQTGQREAHKAHDQDVKRFEKLFKQVGELGDRMDAIDQSIQNALSAFLPANTQLRVSPRTRTDSSPRLSLSVVQPQAQEHPVQNQQVPPAAPVDAPLNDEEPETRPRRNPTRKKSNAANETTNTSTKQESTQASNKEAKPGFAYEFSVTNRALPPSPPRTGKPQPSRPKVKRPVKSTARRKAKEDSDDGIDEIPAVSEEPKTNGNSKKQQKRKRTKTAVNREAPNAFNGDEVALGADDDNNANEAPAQTAKPSKKRKISRSDPFGDAEGRSHGRAPEKATSADAHADDENEHPRPKKKGKKSRKAG